MSAIVTELGTVEELSEILRCCGTIGAPDLRPYQGAEIAIAPVNIDKLVPLARYVLTDRLEFVAALHGRLEPEGVDIFGLQGRVSWLDHGVQRFIAPPIVEFWEEEGFLLVDGLHRVWVARERGFATITCAVIRNVTTPLVPLPIAWERIKVYPCGMIPKSEEKRDYRFPSAAPLRDVVPELRDKVTDQNCRYFLFRDLGPLGSSGVREEPDDSMTGGNLER